MIKRDNEKSIKGSTLMGHAAYKYQGTYIQVWKNDCALVLNHLCFDSAVPSSLAGMTFYLSH